VGAQESLAEPLPSLEWLSADGATLVSIPTSIVDQISAYVIGAYKSVPRRGAEAGGILTGRLKIGRVTEISIAGFELISCDYRFGPSFILPDGGQAEFRSAMNHFDASEILGYYRSNTRPDFAPQASDRETIERVFPGASGLLLLIKPSKTLDLTANYFFFERGRLQPMPMGPEFSFKGSLQSLPSVPTIATRPAAEIPPPAPVPIQQASVSMAALSASMPAEEFKTGKRRKSLQWEVVAAGFMIAAALALLWWQYRGDKDEETAPTAKAPAAAQAASLGLAIQPGAGSWRVSWDPNSTAARQSEKGVLDITEAASHDRIPLSAAQIHSGSATYRPTADDVTFRLELFGSDNSVVSETYRVLLKPREEASAAATAKPNAAAADSGEAPASGPYVDSEVINRVTPGIPEGIRSRITSPQSIDVRVSIDRHGRVTSARALQHEDGLINYLADHAVAAARHWTFTPAKRGNTPIDSTRVINFVFQ
jgi:hypothetical protein